MSKRKTPKEWERALNRWTRQLGNMTTKAVAEASDKMAARAKWYAPHDTGLLVSKIQAKKVKRRDYVISAGIEAKVAHAHLLEFGTVKMAAKPFMRPAVDHELAGLNRALMDAISDSAAKAEAGDAVGSGRFAPARRGRSVLG